MLLKKYRYDYLLIWGHGLKYQNEIIKIIREEPHFEIIKEINFNTKNISKFVKKVYSYDYAPFYHLKSKTKYLKTTPPKVKIIFFKNYSPAESYFGEGRFLHIECERIKRIKEEIRNNFNERKADKRTEDHVIHCSDNESQTDYLLRFLGYKDGVKTFERNANYIINVPHHIKTPDKYKIVTTDIDNLHCSIIEDNKRKVVKIEDSPQYKGGACYAEYLKKYNGKFLKDGYSIEKYNNLCETIKYLEGKYEIDFIITKNIDNKLLIVDGLHRAAILKKSGFKTLKVVVL